MIAKQKILLIILGFLLITNIGMLIFILSSKKPAVEQNQPRQRFSEVLAKEIGFTEAQVAEYKSYREKHRENIKPVFDSLASAKQRYYAAITLSPGLNHETLDSLSEPIGKYQLQLDRIVFDYFTKIRNLATPEQLPLMDSLLPTVVNRMIGNRRDRPQNNAQQASQAEKK